VLSAKKSLKVAMGTLGGEFVLRAVVSVLERTRPQSRMLWRAYAMTLGVFLLRGYRRGLDRFAG